MPERLAISFFLLDITALFLAIFGFLAAVSGLCLTKPEVVERATWGVFSSYSLCAKLHLDWPILAVIIAAVIHSAAGLDVWLARLGIDAWWLWAAAMAVAFWFIYVYIA
ncbi:MAG: hypothetical protein OWQ51_11965 [Pyrobaculum arsenaticum]|uniref:Uncharacterized protein n=2 Tax=Pyrobaculum arsenaticum TaxID=121277 RepID=A4WL35_PYRAR|nr:hypothetical protein [Pyrobaculum arsenaticum]ABP51102.1 conserved hypothetical protein [Pyrobaculum arsenaticum DSM 13514]MCY0891661.1 hypothetical protein [Pyrobaculum arsenaticum]NYR15174.1 hypothetical protein [Pyrobaculum arsenaticum]